MTLRQAGDELGVEEAELERLIERGELPEARPTGEAGDGGWVIACADLAAIAHRHGWRIDLTSVNGTGSALVPHRLQPRLHTPEGAGNRGETPASPPTMAEVLDLAILDRLLGAERDKTRTAADLEHSQSSLAALSERHEQTAAELEIERRERQVSADRYREERTARLVADAKLAELRQRVTREMAAAADERAARAEATDRRLAAEREMARALASMGWLARRRYRKTR